MDLEVNELGKKVKKRPLNNRSKAVQIFIENVNKLAKIAEEKGIKLLIENNVISAKNYSEFKEDPFLMTQSEECIQVMKSVPNNVRMLVDLAHLKVSSNSLKFDAIEFLMNVIHGFLLIILVIMMVQEIVMNLLVKILGFGHI